MVRTIAYHKVKNVATWKSAFEKFIDTRKDSGERSFFVGTSREDPNTVYVINDWDDAFAAQSFFDSSKLAEAMKDSGVLGPPEVQILDYVTKG